MTQTQHTWRLCTCALGQREHVPLVVVTHEGLGLGQSLPDVPGVGVVSWVYALAAGAMTEREDIPSADLVGAIASRKYAREDKRDPRGWLCQIAEAVAMGDPLPNSTEVTT